MRDFLAFCWEGSLAYACRVRLHYADDAVNVMRRDPAPCAGSAGRCIRGSHIRICSMIKIQKCALRPFKEDCAACLYGLVKVNNGVCDERRKFPGRRKIRLVDLGEFDGLLPKCLKNFVVL